MGFKDHLKKSLDNMEQERARKGDRLAGPCSVEYLGGYGNKTKAKGILTLHENLIDFKVALNDNKSFEVPASDIKNISLEGKDEAHRRITVTRMLAVGIFAFALKEKSRDKETFFVAELYDDNEVIFFIDKKSPSELRRVWANALSMYSKHDIESETKVNEPSLDDLERLHDLMEKGVISKYEFEAKKRNILGL